MRRKGSKVGYFWTIDPSGTVARQSAQVSRSFNSKWGFKENCVAVIALHKCGKSDSQIFKVFKPLKISRNFIYRGIKIVRNCGVLKTEFGQDARKFEG